METLIPLMTKAIMVLTITEVLNRYTPKWSKPKLLIPIFSIGLVYLYGSEYLIGDSLFVASFAVLAYEFIGKDFIKIMMTKFKERI